MLKLPRQVTFSSGKIVSYTYTAGGQKLRMAVSGGDTRDYVGVFQYLNNTLFEIAHEEGRYTPTGDYEYFHKDHLGNVRVAFNSGGITQYTDYDPWGLPLWGGLTGGNSTNRDKFNGKESLTEVGPGMLDFGARLYDAAIGRWGVVDPLAEFSRRWSPYSYVFNNPLRFIDPDGMNGIEPRPDTKYSNGYQDVDAYSEAGSVTVNGFLKTEGQQPSGGSSGGSGPCPPNCANRMPQSTIQTYKPDMLDQWKESESLIGQISYGMADGLYAVGQIVTLQGVQNHLGGRGFDNANDALQTTMGGLATAAGPLLGVLGRAVKASEATIKALRPVGSVLESISDVMRNPALLQGRSVEYVKTIVGNSEGWVHDVMRKSSRAEGWMFREMNQSGTNFSGRILQYHPGTPRHYNGQPYWKVSTGSGTTRVPLK